jgi:hypothetical protein
MQRIQLSFTGADADTPALDSLHDWLSNEQLDDVRVEYARGKPAPGHMGVDPVVALSVILGSKAAVELFRSIVAWIQHRKPHVTLKVTTLSGTAEINAENVDGLDSAVRQALRLLNDR